MNANEIEMLAQKFGQALKDITPDAIALAQQMFLIDAIKEGIAALIISFCLMFAYNKRKEIIANQRDSYDREAASAVTSVGVAFIGIIWFICVMSATSNVINMFFPEAALLGKFLK